MKTNNLLISVLALLLTPNFLSSCVRAQETTVDNWNLLSSRTCYFSNEKIQLALLTPAGNGEAAQIHWSFSAQSRTLSRGGGRVTPVHTDEGESFRYQVSLQSPTLRPGVIIPVELRLNCEVAGTAQEFTRTLHFYSRDIVSVEKAFLKHAQIHLYDTEGQTVELFVRDEIPFSQLPNLAAIDALTAGIVIVGEGISFREQQNLSETLLLAASRGIQILCLAPSEGDLQLSTIENGLEKRPARMLFEQGDFVRRYDKRFDQLPSRSQFSLVPRRHGITLSVNATEKRVGWSYLSLDFPSTNLRTDQVKQAPGRLVVCGLGIVQQWDASPVPKYLLIQLLHELVSKPSVEETQKNVSIQ